MAFRAPRSELASPGPDSLTADNSAMFYTWPAIRSVLFALSIAIGLQPKVQAAIEDILSRTYINVEVTYKSTDGKTLQVKYGPEKTAKEGTFEFIAYRGNSLAAGGDPLNNALADPSVTQYYPPSETYTVSS